MSNKNQKGFGTSLKIDKRQEYSSFIRGLIRQLESSKNVPICFSGIANCDKRRQSDLYNIFDGLGVFDHISSKFVVWKGLNSIVGEFIRHGVENEIRSHQETITEIFQVGTSPSLSVLVVKFISLYIYLGIDCLNIRDVAILMADSSLYVNKILRRLYLVVFILEQIGVVEHGYAYSNYIIKQPLDIIIDAIYQEVSKSGMFPEDSVEALLNRFDLVYIKNLQLGRRESYIIATKRFNV